MENAKKSIKTAEEFLQRLEEIEEYLQNLPKESFDKNLKEVKELTKELADLRKARSANSGLSDDELIAKYESGEVDLEKTLKPTVENSPENSKTEK